MFVLTPDADITGYASFLIVWALLTRQIVHQFIDKFDPTLESVFSLSGEPVLIVHP